jgi:hypothetical protein
MDVDALKAKYVGHEFDQSEFGVDAESMRAFATACGETLPKYVDPSDPDFQAPPTYTARYHGRRMLPKDFPMEIGRSFDGGKCVEPKAPIRPGDMLTAKSKIHEIYEKTGRSGGMVFVVHRMEYYNQRDELVSIVDWKLIQKQKAGAEEAR